jgi:drug/metabolite transporter (DMT)-like permease
LSVGAAAAFAFSAMFIAEAGARVPVFQLARWQMGLAVPVLGAISLADGGWATVGWRDLALLGGSSVVGIMLATSTYLAAIVMAGPRVSAVLFSLASPFAVGLGWALLGEALSAGQLGGTGLILLGIVLAVLAERGDAGPGTPPDRRLWLGIGLGAVTALGQAAGSLLARPAMASGVDPATAMAVRSGLGFAFFLCLLAIPGSGRPALPAPADLARIAAASLSGMVLGMSLLMAALARGEVGIVSTLSSTTPILILPMVWATSRRRPPPLAWLGAALAVAGTALISLAG